MKSTGSYILERFLRQYSTETEKKSQRSLHDASYKKASSFSSQGSFDRDRKSKRRRMQFDSSDEESQNNKLIPYQGNIFKRLQSSKQTSSWTNPDRLFKNVSQKQEKRTTFLKIDPLETSVVTNATYLGNLCSIGIPENTQLTKKPLRNIVKACRKKKINKSHTFFKEFFQTSDTKLNNILSQEIIEQDVLSTDQNDGTFESQVHMGKLRPKKITDNPVNSKKNTNLFSARIEKEGKIKKNKKLQKPNETPKLDEFLKRHSQINKFKKSRVSKKYEFSSEESVLSNKNKDKKAHAVKESKTTTMFRYFKKSKRYKIGQNGETTSEESKNGAAESGSKSKEMLTCVRDRSYEVLEQTESFHTKIKTRQQNLNQGKMHILPRKKLATYQNKSRVVRRKSNSSTDTIIRKTDTQRTNYNVTSKVLWKKSSSETPCVATQCGSQQRTRQFGTGAKLRLRSSLSKQEFNENLSRQSHDSINKINGSKPGLLRNYKESKMAQKSNLAFDNGSVMSKNKEFREQKNYSELPTPSDNELQKKFATLVESISSYIGQTKCSNNKIENDPKINMFVSQGMENKVEEQNLLNTKPDVTRKSQNNLHSSEGFHESMSYETPTQANIQIDKHSVENNFPLTKCYGSKPQEKISTEYSQCSCSRSLKHLQPVNHSRSNYENHSKYRDSSLSIENKDDLKSNQAECNNKGSNNKTAIYAPNTETFKHDSQGFLGENYGFIKTSSVNPATNVSQRLRNMFNYQELVNVDNAISLNKLVDGNKSNNADLMTVIQSNTKLNQQFPVNKPKESLSGPISFESPSLIFSANEIPCCNKTTNNNRTYTSLLHQGSNQSSAILKSRQKLQKKDTFDSQTLENLYRIHESNNWDSSSLTQSKRAKNTKNSYDVNENTINRSQEAFSSSTTKSYLENSEQYLPKHSHVNFQNKYLPNELKQQIYPPASKDVSKTNLHVKSFGDNRENNNFLIQQTKGHTLTNCEELCTQESQVLLTQTQESDTQNTNKKSRKTFKLTEHCILYEDNLLKDLLEKKPKIQMMYNKNQFGRKLSEESVEVLAKTYIKRYKKGKTKIFKIKRRLKRVSEKNYEPPEDKIMDRFIKGVNEGFDKGSSSGNEDGETILTPLSYKTDETKSEVLSTGSAKLTNHQQLLREGINKLSKDKTLVFSRFSDSVPKELDGSKILARIQELICRVLEDYERGQNPCFRIPKVDEFNCVFQDERYQLKEVPEYSLVNYKFSSRRARFNLLLFILNKIRILLETNTKLTKREIYYQLKTMISFQTVTDRAIHDVSKMLNVGIWALNVTAQKGLVYGNLKLVMSNGETMNCNVPGTLVPKDVSEICEIQSDAYFILVVEKESIFHKLLEENLPNRLTRPFILVTGKGFPDLNTQLFLKKLWMTITVPVFILVDADPDGIAIMLNYRFGSVANAHVSEHLAIPKARWIGVFPSEIPKLSLAYEPLTKREVFKTQRLLQLQCVKENERIKRQLEVLLENGIKSGIEGVMKTETYLSHRYLSLKFYSNDLI